MSEGNPPLDLARLAPSLYAQGTEEAILTRILRAIEPTNRYCVDIGASDGLLNSNTALLLREEGWLGTLVEGSAYRFGRLKENYGDAANVRLVGQRVQPDTVDDLLDEAGVPGVYDLLSLDIDGNDYWVWRALRRHRARVVVDRDLYPRLGIANNDTRLLFRPAMYHLRYVGHNTFLTGHPYRYGPGEAL